MKLKAAKSPFSNKLVHITLSEFRNIDDIDSMISLLTLNITIISTENGTRKKTLLTSKPTILLSIQ